MQERSDGQCGEKSDRPSVAVSEGGQGLGRGGQPEPDPDLDREDPTLKFALPQFGAGGAKDRPLAAPQPRGPAVAAVDLPPAPPPAVNLPPPPPPVGSVKMPKMPTVAFSPSLQRHLSPSSVAAHTSAERGLSLQPSGKAARAASSNRDTRASSPNGLPTSARPLADDRLTARRETETKEAYEARYYRTRTVELERRLTERSRALERSQRARAAAEAERDELKRRLQANRRREERAEHLEREKLIERNTRELRVEIDKLNGRLARETERQQAEIAKRDRELEQQKQQLQQLKQLREQNDERGQKLDRQEQGLRQLQEEIEERGQKIEQQEQRLRRLQEEIEERDRRLERQKHQLQQLRAQIDEGEPRAERAAAEQGSEEGQRMGTVRQLQTPAAASCRDAAEPEDDLKRIRGIGPRFERALKDNGIGQYEQIAAWGPAEIEEIAGKIGVNAKRIVRDKWVQSARELMARSGPRLAEAKTARDG